MSEQRLRDLLQQAVPEAPDMNAKAIEHRLHRQRRTRAALTASGAALAILVGAVAVSSLADNDNRRPAPEDAIRQPTVSTTTPGALSPYDVPPCPARLPDPSRTGHSIASLDDVVALRLCPDLDPRGQAPSAATPEQISQFEDDDALVRDLADFATAVRNLPAGLPDYCTTEPGPYIGQTFAFYRADGTRVLVGAPGCALITIDGHPVHSETVRQVYVGLLDDQRERYDYTRAFDDQLLCDSTERGGPLRAGREELVAAVACDLPPGAESIPEDLKPVTLNPAQLAKLNRAWSQPDETLYGSDACLTPTEPPSYILAATDRSDVVQLINSPCGFLGWLGGENRIGASLPTTLEALGLD